MNLPQPLNDWAKTYNHGIPGIPVLQHLLTAGYVAEELLRRFPRICKRCHISKEALLFLTASHDVGKLSLDFLKQSKIWLENQNLLQQARQEDWAAVYTLHHAEISYRSVASFLLEQLSCDGKSAELWGAVVGAHHGKIRKKPDENTEFEELRQSCLQKLKQFYGTESLPEIHDKNAPCLWCIAGFITLADWIASDESFFPADQLMDSETLKKKTREAVASIGLGVPHVRENLSFADIFSGRTPYPLQSSTAQMITGPGIYVIEAPMGMGKTEAALWAAYHLLAEDKADGIYFALPTQASGNRMFLRFADFVHAICPDITPVQLIHGNSWLQDDLKALACPPSPENDVEFSEYCWFNSSRRSLFAPFGVGTVDQALLSILAVKYFTLRRFALMGKVVIIDEVHTYDTYTGTLIQKLCSELEKLGCTVIILSATLTEKARCELLDLPVSEENADARYPRLSASVRGEALPEIYPSSRPDIAVQVGHLEHDEAVGHALDLAAKGAQILWICDTVDSAQNDFLLLKNKAAAISTDIDFGLLHARFPFFIRNKLEADWMERFGTHGKREHGAILVSTQIVEQSVDLDADVMFSELAPTDMLLQRLGRLWRHPRDPRPVPRPLFYLLKESSDYTDLTSMDAEEIKNILGNKARIYQPYCLLRSLELWENLKILNLPSDIRTLITQTYIKRESVEDWENMYQHDLEKARNERCKAVLNTNIWKTVLDDQKCPQTRLTDPSYTLVLCTEYDGSHMTLLDGQSVTLSHKQELETAKKLANNTVTMRTYHFTGLPHDSKLKTYHIDGCLQVDEENMGLSAFVKGRSLSWDNLLGVVNRKEEE